VRWTCGHQGRGSGRRVEKVFEFSRRKSETRAVKPRIVLADLLHDCPASELSPQLCYLNLRTLLMTVDSDALPRAANGSQKCANLPGHIPCFAAPPRRLGATGVSAVVPVG
jgi:hypothetical protein